MCVYADKSAGKSTTTTTYDIMKTTLLIGASCLSAFAVCSLPIVLADPSSTDKAPLEEKVSSKITLTSTDGRKIKVELQHATDSAVTVRRADGQTFTLPLERLIPENRAYIARWQKQNRAPAPGMSPFGSSADDVSAKYNRSKAKRVSTVKDLESAVKKAQPGDVILIEAGTYDNVNLSLSTPGTKEKPIILGAVNPGKVTLKNNSQINFVSEHWIVRDLFFFDSEERAKKQPMIYFRGGDHNRATNCLLLRNGQGTMVASRPLASGSLDFARYNRLDHSAIINYGTANVRNWQSAGLISHGTGNKVLDPRYAHMNSTRRFVKEQMDEQAYWENIDTPAYFRIDHCYINGPLSTQIIWAQTQLKINVPFAAEKMGVSISKIPAAYRDREIFTMGGILFDSNLIDMYSHQAISYFKAAGFTWLNNTFHKGQLMAWTKPNDAALLNYFLNEESERTPFSNAPGIKFNKNHIVAGNYIERKPYQGGHHAYGGNHNSVFALGAGRPVVKHIEDGGALTFDSLYANNFIKLSGGKDKEGQTVFNGVSRSGSWMEKPYDDNQDYRNNKFLYLLIQAYGGKPSSVPNTDTPAQGNTIINNVLLATDDAPHQVTTHFDGWAKARRSSKAARRGEIDVSGIKDWPSPWPTLFKKNLFSHNYASADMLKRSTEKLKGFAPIATGFDAKSYIPQYGKDMPMKRVPVQNHYMLPVKMDSLIFDRRVESLGSFDYQGAALGLENVDFRDLGDTIALARPLSFEDVGPAWFSKDSLRAIGLKHRNNTEGYDPSQKRSKIVKFPLPGTLKMP